MIVFILLGGAAGILNVFRLANGFGYVVGYKKDKETQKDKPGDENP
jgi:F0F1-type ATP synthase assembly protein I